MKQLVIFALGLMAIFISSCGNEQKEKTSTADTLSDKKDSIAEPRLELVWETDTTLTTCESALHISEGGFIYVSCINGDPTAKDGNGFISKVGTEGKVENLKWSQGKLNAPKGMGKLNDVLYVTDIDELVQIDLKSGKIIKKIRVPNAVFLNDVTVSEGENTVYFSDSEASVIYRYRNDSVQVFMKDTIQAPNGLLKMDNEMYVASFKGDFKKIDIPSKKVTQIVSGIGGGDGVVFTGVNNQFLVSNWYGEVFVINPDNSTIVKILDTKEQKISAADIDFIKDKNILLVPAFFANKLMAYEVKW